MSKSDRELLELAAKAAGITLSPMEISNVEFKGDNHFIGFLADVGQCQRGWFNPLTDDGDALRLASDLELEVSFGRYGAIIYMKGGVKIEEISEDYRPAIRKAIVRAAAAIGETLP